MLVQMLSGPRSRDTYGDDKIKSEVMYAGERRYYLDLKENSRGRFLKVIAVLLLLVLAAMHLVLYMPLCLGGSVEGSRVRLISLHHAIASLFFCRISFIQKF